MSFWSLCPFKRHLLGLIADRLLLIDGGTAREFDGSIEDYRDSVLGTGKNGRAKNGKGKDRAKSGAQDFSQKEYTALAWVTHIKHRLIQTESEIRDTDRNLVASAHAKLLRVE